MNAVLLCAGFATRMYPLTSNFPKPLLPVADRPVIDYLLEQIADLRSIRAVHLVSNARFHDHFRRWRDSHQERGTWGSLVIEVHNDGCLDNDSRLGAAGDLALALKLIGAPDKILVSGGDNIYRFALAPLWNDFLRGGEHRVVALAETEPANLHKTGVLEFGDNDRVLRLHEKPEVPPSQWICPPLYFFQASVWTELDAFLATAADNDAPGHFVDYLCTTSRVKGFRLNSSRLDIGSIDSYQFADQLLRKESSARSD
jgi:glucose-1-phosphate thymidylyltransferase